MTRQSFWFHEDDYGQCEVLPLANGPWCHEEIREIDASREANAVDMGDGIVAYAEMHMRPPTRVTLASLDIHVEDVSALLRPLLPVRDEVYTGSASGPDELCKNTIAFGCICVEWSGQGRVDHLWCPPGLGAENRLEIRALQLLGSRYPLLYVDWNWSLVVPLDGTASLLNELVDTGRPSWRGGGLGPPQNEPRRDPIFRQGIADAQLNPEEECRAQGSDDAAASDKPSATSAVPALFRWWLATDTLPSLDWVEVSENADGFSIDGGKRELQRGAASAPWLALSFCGYEPLIDLLLDGDVPLDVRPPRDHVSSRAREHAEAWLGGGVQEPEVRDAALREALAGDPAWFLSKLQPAERATPELEADEPTERLSVLESVLFAPWRESASALSRWPLRLVLPFDTSRPESPKHASLTPQTQQERELVSGVLTGPLPQSDDPRVLDDILSFAVEGLAKKDRAWLRRQIVGGPYPRSHRVFVARCLSRPL